MAHSPWSHSHLTIHSCRCWVAKLDSKTATTSGNDPDCVCILQHLYFLLPPLHIIVKRQESFQPRAQPMRDDIHRECLCPLFFPIFFNIRFSRCFLSGLCLPWNFCGNHHKFYVGLACNQQTIWWNDNASVIEYDTKAQIVGTETINCKQSRQIKSSSVSTTPFTRMLSSLLVNLVPLVLRL